MAKKAYVYTGTDWVPLASDLPDPGNFVAKNNGEANYPVIKSPEETVTISATAATGTVNIDLLTSSVHYYTDDATANWTFNLRGSSATTLNSILDIGASISCVFLVTNGASAYYPNEYLVDGGPATVYFQGGSWPSSGNALSVDAYTFTVLKTADATFTVFGAQTQFGN